MTTRPLHAATVRVPGSTSNLGGGFDTVGLALDRYLIARFEPGDGASLEVVREGMLRRLEEFPGPDLVAETFQKRLSSEGLRAAGRLVLSSDIPVIRGFGSSAAALVAGSGLADAALGREIDRDRCFQLAYTREGHGDNAAPSVFGGLRVVVPGGHGPRVLRGELSPHVGFAYAAPAAPFATREAREALPSMVPHGAAVRSLGRLAALLEGLRTADPELIRSGTDDELHVPFRLPRIQGAAEALQAGFDAGAWGVTISGGGSGLIAVCAPERAEAIGVAMREAFRTQDDEPECVGFAVRPDLHGIQRL